ncbi:helicase associated domain-containing protein [Streptomyces sp. AP-93]|uniref:helicase associated domain-containing protein n=1 Tax=Streptomyces sp. AP-93 TaxID=2929048 RepID=UPI001FAFC00D|nr:helicase associated domain-containing protein [Streptomyces sp. AP-93]MCJ0872562.1 helicase associated domain-containing protein [Streptomyces sp. AP-93]
MTISRVPEAVGDLAKLLAAGARLEDVPGVTHRGEDIGRWLTTQRRDFVRLDDEQQARLGVLGVKAAVRPRRTATKTPATFHVPAGRSRLPDGRAGIAQYRDREGGRMPGLGHVELLPDGG